MKDQDKDIQYASMIAGKIAEIFDSGSLSDFYIDQKELLEGDNVTHFIHALANLVPTMMYNNITGENKNNLQFNHIANQLVFQYSKKSKRNKAKNGLFRKIFKR